MRRVLPIVVFCLLAASFTGCKKAKLRSQLKELMASTIVLPDRITCINNGEVYPMPDSLRDRPKLIVYIDSSECTTCRISHIGKYHELFRISQEKGSFEVVLLLPYVELNGIPLIQYLSDLELEYPVFVDVDNMFLSMNASIPMDQRMHAFFVNKQGHPMCVGDPIRSEKMYQLFLNEVQAISDNQF